MSHGLEFVLVSDIDGSLMTKRMEEKGATASELRAQRRIRDRATGAGRRFGVATAQTVEMLLSRRTFVRSEEQIKRPSPFLQYHQEEGRYTYVDPESIACRTAFTDPDFVLSMGTGIFAKNADGTFSPYKPFMRKLRPGWRKSLLALLYALPIWGSSDFTAHLADIDSEANYYRRLTNVFPNDYRLQLTFNDPERSRTENEDLKNQAKYLLESMVEQLSGMVHGEIPGSERASLLAEYGAAFDNLLIVDESRPAANHFMIYLMALLASKDAMADEYLKHVAGRGRIKDLVFFGDMPPDLRMGCMSGDARRVAFVLAGGSPIAPHLTRGNDAFGKPYAGESLKWLTDCLIPTDRPGIETFKRRGFPARTIVIGDALYPGLVGPETLAAYLDAYVPE